MANFIALCVSGLPDDLIQNAILYYDGEKEQKSFKNTLRAALYESMQSGIFLRDIKALPASRVDGLQVADMLAGFIRNDPHSIRSVMIKVIQYPD